MTANSLPTGSNFIRSVRSFRLQIGLTQIDLARAMKDLGFPFHQQTIQRIEEGRRSVRLDEAYALAKVLSSSIDDMATCRGPEPKPTPLAVPAGCVAIDDEQFVNPAAVRVLASTSVGTDIHLRGGNHFLVVAKPIDEVMRLLVGLP